MMISVLQALDMMMAHAPRSWCKRVLAWEVSRGSVGLYFASGRITDHVSKFIILANVSDSDDDAEEEEQVLLKRIAQQYGADVAAGVANAKNEHDPVLLLEDKWSAEARLVPGQLVLFADEVDWDRGSLSIEIDRDLINQFEGWEEFQASDRFSRVKAELNNMCFELSEIELLAPGGVLKPDSAFKELRSPQRGGPGRRKEYDWESAILHLLGEAEKNSIAPDPDAHGAQADVKRRLAEWFAEHGGKVPADSQLQVYAGKVLSAIRAATP